MNKKQCNNVNSTEVNKEEVLIFYENQINEQYKKGQQIINDIISNNVKTTDHNKRMQIIIYYRNCKVTNLIMKNNMTRNNDKLSTSHVVYFLTGVNFNNDNEILKSYWKLEANEVMRYNCPRGDSALQTFRILNEILTWMNQHQQDGAILEHMSSHHDTATVSLDELSSNVKILKVIPDFKTLIKYEALTLV